MKINVYSIEKNQNQHIKNICDEYAKMSSKYAILDDNVIFNNRIAKAQNTDEKKAKEEYFKAYEQYMQDGFNICLDVNGKSVDSFEFSELLKDKSKINFFIGGAYGFETSILKASDKVISLSPLTCAHKIAKVMLFEQIYRGLSIIHAHPYHK